MGRINHFPLFICSHLIFSKAAIVAQVILLYVPYQQLTFLSAMKYENIKDVIITVTITISVTVTISVTIDNSYLLQENLVTTLILDEDTSRGSRSRNQTILDIFDTIYTKYSSSSVSLLKSFSSITIILPLLISPP